MTERKQQEERPSSSRHQVNVHVNNSSSNNQHEDDYLPSVAPPLEDDSSIGLMGDGSSTYRGYSGSGFVPIIDPTESEQKGESRDRFFQRPSY